MEPASNADLSDLGDVLRGIVQPFFVIPGNELRIQKIIFIHRVALNRTWFQSDVDGFALRSYNHESRTAQYERTADGALVTLQCYENWFPRGVEPLEAARAFQSAKTALEKECFESGMLSSPTLTGLHAFESKLPFELPEGCPQPAWRTMLHLRTTQSRTEIWLPKTVSEFWYLDRRFAYAADAVLELPCGEPVLLEGEAAKPVPYETAWYEVIFEVPKGWQHVGLIPVLTGNLSGFEWAWPNEGRHGAFVAEPELRVALAAGWKVEVLKKWLFEKARPLEKPVKLLIALYERAKNCGQSVEAGIYRDFVLRAIGGMYARSYDRERIVSEAEILEIEDSSALTAQQIEGDRYAIKERTEKREGRFYQPEWTAYIWSRARARLNAALLSLPYESLIGCHVDAIYTDREPLTIADNGRVGQFRLKGKLGCVVSFTTQPGAEFTLRTMADVQKVKGFAEAVMRTEGGE